MTEIMAHPWMTYTSFPKYIDYKLIKIQNLSTRSHKDSINEVILSEVLQKPFNRKDCSTQIEIEKAIKENDHNKSFVIGYNLACFENKKENRKKQKESKKSPTNPVFTFGILENIFDYKESLEKFKKQFRNYTIDLFKNYNRVPWRIGINFCTNLKKLIKTFLRAANSEGIRVEINSPSDFKFRCFFVSQTQEDTGEAFSMQIFDNSDEYVMDFINEKTSNIKFLLTCFKLYQTMKA